MQKRMLPLMYQKSIVSGHLSRYVLIGCRCSQMNGGNIRLIHIYTCRCMQCFQQNRQLSGAILCRKAAAAQRIQHRIGLPVIHLGRFPGDRRQTSLLLIALHKVHFHPDIAMLSHTDADVILLYGRTIRIAYSFAYIANFIGNSCLCVNYTAFWHMLHIVQRSCLLLQDALGCFSMTVFLYRLCIFTSADKLQCAAAFCPFLTGIYNNSILSCICLSLFCLDNLCPGLLCPKRNSSCKQ